MISETRKSINSILYERISSPFFGTLIISWLLWNWKIVYTTFIVSSEDIGQNKIDYIVSNFNDSNYLIWLPLASTIILLTVIPFVSNGAYWLNLKFDKWRVDKKAEIEKKKLLTIEQSIQLREQIVNMENQFDSLLRDKNNEIDQLKILVNDLNKNIDQSNPKIVAKKQAQDITSKAEEFKNIIKANVELEEGFEEISKQINENGIVLFQKKQLIGELSFFEANRLIEENPNDGSYFLTALGNELRRLYINERYS